METRHREVPGFLRGEWKRRRAWKAPRLLLTSNNCVTRVCSLSSLSFHRTCLRHRPSFFNNTLALDFETNWKVANCINFPWVIDHPTVLYYLITFLNLLQIQFKKMFRINHFLCSCSHLGRFYHIRVYPENLEVLGIKDA